MAEWREIEAQTEGERRVNLFAGMEGPYDWAMDEDWEKVIGHFEKHTKDLLSALTLDGDNVFHVAAALVSEGKDVLERLIDLLPDDHVRRDALMSYNSHGNTVLHEVAVAGNLDAAKLLLDRFGKPDESREYPGLLLEIPNKLGETPLYRAAVLGHTKLVRFFAGKVVNIDKHLRRVADKKNILHIAIIGRQFGTALWLQNNYEFLVEEKDDKGSTSLQLLAQMRKAFEPKFDKSWWKMLIYHCLPVEDEPVSENQKDDLESSLGRNQPRQSYRRKKHAVFSRVWFFIWDILAKGWRKIDEIRKEKENQMSLKKLTRSLVKKDFSWQVNKTGKDKTISLGSVESLISGPNHDQEKGKTATKVMNATNAYDLPHTPLIIATCSGAVPIVEQIMEVHPQAVEHVNDKEHNILHLAIRHRQYRIFKLVKRRKTVWTRLIARIDADGNTILHQASDSGHHSTADQRINGPAMQLQDELHWVERVQRIIPPHYIDHHNEMNKTAEDVFNATHNELLNLAKTWMKDTAQACTIVGVLVATLVFAAAFQVPGGTEDNGLPRFRNNPFFWAFTVMDIVSLCSSLASVVMFLSILTSPLEYPNFRHSLPRKLKSGFVLLFLSMITTMLAFCATIFLLIHDLQRKWTRSLVYTVALLPVIVFGLVQFPLYHAFSDGVKFVYKKTFRKIFPPACCCQKKAE